MQVKDNGLCRCERWYKEKAANDGQELLKPDKCGFVSALFYRASVGHGVGGTGVKLKEELRVAGVVAGVEGSSFLPLVLTLMNFQACYVMSEFCEANCGPERLEPS